jgi:hypothetical protein
MVTSNPDVSAIEPPWSPIDAGRCCVYVASLNDPTATEEVRVPATLETANLISSQCLNGLHAPALDIDSSVAVVRSSTTGHFHLYLDKPVSWRAYRRILRALYLAGYVEAGVYWRSLDRGATFLRLPWVRKTDDEAAHGSHDAPREPRKAQRALAKVRRRVQVKRAIWCLTGR